jgi:hypothetical protein
MRPSELESAARLGDAVGLVEEPEEGVLRDAIRFGALHGWLSRTFSENLGFSHSESDSLVRDMLEDMPSTKLLDRRVVERPAHSIPQVDVDDRLAVSTEIEPEESGSGFRPRTQVEP